MLATFGYGPLSERSSLTRGTSMSYDPLMRLYTEVSWNSPRHVYDGAHSIAEYRPDGSLIIRTVYGPGADEPIVSLGSTGARPGTWPTSAAR